MASSGQGSESKEDEKPPRRWIEPGEHNGEHVALASYPRSGNTLARTLLEAVFGCYTGCDTHPERALSLELQKCGLLGEGEVGDKVWLVKTHFPERPGYKPFKISKALVLVRNPFDAIDSYFNQTMTNSHNSSVHESQYERFAEVWDGLVRSEADIWVRFIEYWEKSFVPVLLIRFEVAHALSATPDTPAPFK